jgi:hypothetical protein
MDDFFKQNKLNNEIEQVYIDKPFSGPCTPKAHKNHTDGVLCCCWVGKGTSISCRWCGASYLIFEVMEFPVFQCYDCGASVHCRNLEEFPAEGFSIIPKWPLK